MVKLDKVLDHLRSNKRVAKKMPGEEDKILFDLRR